MIFSPSAALVCHLQVPIYCRPIHELVLPQS